MGEDMSRSGVWALAMSGRRARILRGLNDVDGDEPVELLARVTTTRPGGTASDKAGRSFSSGATGRRSAMEPGSDPIRHEMQEFAREAVEFLERHRKAGDFTRLAVFAEPKMLGILRSESPTSLWATVFLDLPVNLVSLPQGELRERVLEFICTSDKAR